jgi:hypothetical protein
MPGPVSDSFDPEFSTVYNASLVGDAARELANKLSNDSSLNLGERKYILEVIFGKSGRLHSKIFSEKEFRIMRFCLERVAEELS